MEHLEMQKAMDPAIGPQMQAYEIQIQKWIDNNENTINDAKTVVTVPVVVHIVYNTSIQNISDTRVLEQMNVLNRDYAGLNSHSLYGFSSGLKVNTELQFCLAQRKPDGTATNGIERRQTSITSFTYDDKVKSYTKGGLDAWDPTKYINIWVCNLSGNLCGYAQFPTSGVNSTFGVVIMYQYFGVTGATAPYNLGGTTTHEIGHCFNLYHIWGDDNGACTGTDNCSDTPNQADANYGVPAYPHVSCSNGTTGDMFMNFMDYSDDAVYSNFTPNQKARIQACFAPGGLLYSLSTSNGCVPPGTVACDVTSGLNAISVTQSGATLNWNSITAATGYNIQYRLSGAVAWSTVTSATNSKVLSGLNVASTYEFQVQTVCQAGTSAFSASGTFTTQPSSCSDIYESNNTLSTARSIAVNTNITAMIGNSTDVDYFKFNNTSAQKKIKITLANLPADYDVALYQSNGTRVGISQNSGTVSESVIYNTTAVGTYYIKVFGYGNSFSATDCYTLKAVINSTNFRIDGTDSTTDTESAEEFEDNASMNIFPNPAGEKLTVQYNIARDCNINIRIFDITGKLVLTNQPYAQKGMNSFELELGILPRGIYIVNVTDGLESIMRKLILDN